MADMLVANIDKTIKDFKFHNEIGEEYVTCEVPLFICKAVVKALDDAKTEIIRLNGLLKKQQPKKVNDRKELADLIVGSCPECNVLFNNEICPTACGWCGCLLDWKDGEQE